MDLVQAVRADGTTTLRELDVGGGLGIRYHDETPISPRDFAAALEAAGKPVQLIVGQNYNHFEIGATLDNPCAKAWC